MTICSDTGVLLTLRLPIVPRADVHTLLEEGAQAGKSNGLDRGWRPSCLDEALYELLLAGDSLVRVAAPGEEHTTIAVVVRVSSERELCDAAGESGDDADGLGLERRIARAMAMPASPVDMGFEIHQPMFPTTAHARMASLQRAEDVYARVAAVVA